MTRFILHHRHRAEECPVVFAAWSGFQSPLRHRSTVGSCPLGGHEMWWVVEADSAASALGQLPRYLAERTRATHIDEVVIP